MQLCATGGDGTDVGDVYKRAHTAITELHSKYIITCAMSLAPSAIEEGFTSHFPLVAYFPSSAVTPLLLMMVRITAEK